jgi:hypothetical protein
MVPFNLVLEEPELVGLNVFSGLCCWVGYFVERYRKQNESK